MSGTDESEDFKLDNTNKTLRKYYEENENYKRIISDLNNKRCIIFFSGNGLYYPNTSDVFYQKVVVEDRYEWEGVAQSPLIKETFGTVIFVRDIYKTYYMKGINGDVSNIEKLLILLKEITSGLRVTTCGNSAGGYMAVIAGNYLQADWVFSFGGQWNIEHTKEYFVEACKKEWGKYYNIVNYAKENVVWFYSALNEDDNIQKSYLGEDNKAMVFAMRSKYHGFLLLFPCYKVILTLSNERIKKLHKKYQNRLISQRRFAAELLHGGELFRTCFKDIMDHHKSLQILFSYSRKSK